MIEIEKICCNVTFYNHIYVRWKVSHIESDKKYSKKTLAYGIEMKKYKLLWEMA